MHNLIIICSKNLFAKDAYNVIYEYYSNSKGGVLAIIMIVFAVQYSAMFIVVL